MFIMQSENENEIKNVTLEEISDDGLVVDMQHVRKSFGDHEVLKDVNLKIAKGENVVVLGKSGGGKSVIIKCLVRLMDADGGKIIALGKDMATLNDDELNEMRKKIGFLFQSAALYDSMSVRDNLEFPLREMKKTKEEKTQMVEAALKSVGLESAIDLMPVELSGGMRKRVGLARTMILNPAIMLYDEPTTGLDPITSKEISKLILQVQKEYKTSSLIITHDIECAKITSNRVIVLKDGEFIAEGTFKELEKSDDPYVRSFFE
jgi:phospholipid/cholesterol/gamma-HCH transport system ATP-binding protein